MIIIKPEQVWDYAKEHNKDLKDELMLVAEEPEFGVEVYITSSTDGVNVQVYVDTELIEYADFSSAQECEEMMELLYASYVSNKPENSGVIAETRSEENNEEVIEEREQELSSAAENFLEEIAPNLIQIAGEEYDDIISDIIDLACQYLFKERGISVYRPMILDDDSKDGVFTEFPYPQIDFSS